MEKIGRVTRKTHICNTGGSVCLDRQLGKPQTSQQIHSMKELLSKWFNGRRKNNSCLCRENYRNLMSNHHEKDKEGNAFMYSSERENKTFWLFQKQRKMYPTEDCLPHHISAPDEKRKKHNLVLHFLLYSATFQVIFSLKRNTSTVKRP